MNISFVFKNFEASEHLKKYARRRMEKLGRFFGKNSDIDVSVALSVDKFRHRCEVTLTGEGLHVNAGEQTQDMYAAIDIVTDKVESQVKKRVAKVKEQRRTARETNVDVFTFTMDGEAEDLPDVVGTKRFASKPLYLDEALMQLESIGSDFLVFFNAENNRINVVYRRRNQGYGLIDPVL
ncbi:MAG: ribosome-associated translation inhibitor RaiA [Desulfovibrio sp.]|nr:ribosome-associated translation inhibitor RaiA [Desulfovibrio sp.]